MPAPPRTNDERELERLQRTVTNGLLATQRRNLIIMRLWDEGMTQPELAARLTRAARAAGGSPVSENSIYKMLKRRRNGPPE